MLRYIIFLIVAVSLLCNCKRSRSYLESLEDQDELLIKQNDEIIGKIKAADSLADTYERNYRLFYKPFYDRNFLIGFWIDSLNKVIRMKQLSLFYIWDIKRIDSGSNHKLSDMDNSNRLMNGGFFQMYKNDSVVIDLKGLMLMYARKFYSLVDNSNKSYSMVTYVHLLENLITPDTSVMYKRTEGNMLSSWSWKTAMACQDYIYLAHLRNNLLRIKYYATKIFTEDYGENYLKKAKERYDSLTNKATKQE